MIFENNLSPVLLQLGPLEVRYYGLLFALGILSYYLIATWIFKREKVSINILDSVIVYLFFGMLIGARLGEVFFYTPEYFWENPLDIVKVWQGGLSSHGATIGLFVAFLIWIKVQKISFNKYADMLVIPMPLVATFVRVGNFFNSEIVGKPTGNDYGVIFRKLGEDFPRHPAQLYEGFLSLLVFFVLLFVYKKYYKKTPPLFLMFLYMLLYFGGRLITEIWKDLHVLPENFPLSMGQILSITPVVLALGYFGILAFRRFNGKNS